MSTLANLPGLTTGEQSQVNQLVEMLNAKAGRNHIRDLYYESKMRVRNLGIAVPDALSFINPVLDWPEKAVTVLEDRLDLQGWVYPGSESDTFGLADIWADNNLNTEASMAHRSGLRYGAGYVGVMSGDVASGEPEAIVRGLSAASTAGLYSPLKRRLTAAVSIISKNQAGQPECVIAYFPDRVITFEKTRSGWNTDIRPHSLGRVPVALLPYRPSLENAYGESRISRSVMSITDRTLRSLLRLESGLEFFSFPQRVILGADEDAFLDAEGNQINPIALHQASMLMLGVNEAGEMPNIQQLPQNSPTPSIEAIRMDAALFSGATNIPVSELGIIHDNPSSADAIERGYTGLIKTTERLHETYGDGWAEIARLAVGVREGSMIPELNRVRSKWGDPSTPTQQSRSQSVTMEIGSGLLDPNSAITMERAGFDETTIQRRMAELKRGNREKTLTELKEMTSGNVSASTGTD